MSDGMLRGPLFGRLGFRLMAAVGLVLLPLAYLAYVQAGRFEAEAVQRVEVALVGETLRAAAPEIEGIRRASGAVAALAEAVLPLVADPQACSELLRRFAERDGNVSFVGYIPADGRMTCLSRGETIDFADDPRLAARVANPDILELTVNPRGAISKESVLIFSHAVRSLDGTVLGFLSLSLPHRALGAGTMSIELGQGASEPLALMTFDDTGTVLTARNGLATAAERLPVHHRLSEFVGQQAQTFADETAAGRDRIFAVVPLVDDAIYVLASWPPPDTELGALGLDLPLWAFPMAMWLASLVVAWIAAEHQVLRHVRSLRASITTFADGNRTVEPPNLERAPNELRDVGDAYERLVDSVLHDEATLEDTVHQKEVLLREVHHRVKNNLQLIASIMNIQMRKAVSPEARALVRGLHDRVMSLATVHRELYQTSGLTDVKADELLTTICTQVLRMGASPSRAVDLSTQFDPIRLTPDQSVPLSLLLTEALTNVLKHAGSGSGQRVALSVSLTRRPEGRAMLRVANSVPDQALDRTMPPRPESSGLGEQLLSAFAMQLSGVLSVAQNDDSYALTVDFPVRALSEAEQRFAAS